MDEIVFSCPSCGRSYRVDARLAGKKVRCTGCSHVGRVETASPAPGAEAASAGDPPGLTFPCPRCGQGFRLSAEVAGRRVRCRSCGEVFRIPSEDAPSAVGCEEVEAATDEGGTPPPAASPAQPAAAIPKGAKAASSPSVRRLALGTTALLLSIALYALLPRAWDAFESLMGTGRGPNDLAGDAQLDMPDVSPDRLPLVRQHRQVLSEMADAYVAMAAACGGMRDPSKFESSRNDLLAASKRLGDAAGRGARLEALQTAEKAALASFVNERVVPAAGQAGQQVNALMAAPGLQGDFGAMRQAIGQALQQLGREYPSDAPRPAVLLSMGKVPSDVSRVVTEKAKALIDGPTGVSVGWRTENDRSELRISPVLSARAFADAIDFGKVRRVRGRRIELEVEPPSAEEIARYAEPASPASPPPSAPARKDGDPSAAAPPPADSDAPSIVVFRWLDADGDLVGPNHGDESGKPDGRKDQHFLLEMDFPARAVVEEITVIGEGPDRWVTKSDSSHWPLVVRQGETPITRSFADRIGEFSGKQSFDLFGNTGTESKPGSEYRVEVVASSNGVRHTLRGQCRRS